ncbi:hypothetical protein FS749_000364 [Ceratobasidium sp. UAMH 11750]|nr:hypothetical protein FS749_000364 [Ceratobasidium sp. UAMH 11750]
MRYSENDYCVANNPVTVSISQPPSSLPVHVIRKARRLGRHLSEYFLEDPANAFFPRDKPIPSIQYGKTIAITHLERVQFQSVTSETLTALEGILWLIRHPKELRWLNHTTLLASCIELLQDYTDELEDDEKLFSYEFGFLCFRVIILLIQVGILAQMGSLQAFLKETRNLSDPKDISAALAKFVAKPVDESYLDEDFRDRLLGAKTLDGARKLLPTIGSFTDEDASFLLEQLWEDRKTFSLICRKGQALTSGFAFILVVIQEHMHWTFEEASSNEVDEDWTLIDTLSFRCSLVAPSYYEVSILISTCKEAKGWLFESEHEYDVLSLVDVEDAKNVMEAYTSRLTHQTSGRKVYDWDLVLILEFITHDSMLTYVHLLPGFVKTTFLWAWNELIDNEETGILDENTSLASCAAHAVSFITRSCHFLKEADNATRLSITRVLSETDFVAFMGRLMLAPMATQSWLNWPLAESGKDHNFRDNTHGVKHNWENLVHEMGVFGRVVKGAKILGSLPANAYSDWLKTRRCFQALFPHHEVQSDWFKNYVKICYPAWLEFGSAFGTRV